jgi:hypothetical protein
MQPTTKEPWVARPTPSRSRFPRPRSPPLTDELHGLREACPSSLRFPTIEKGHLSKQAIGPKLSRKQARLNTHGTG